MDLILFIKFNINILYIYIFFLHKNINIKNYSNKHILIVLSNLFYFV